MYEPRLYMSDDQIKKSIKSEYFWSPFIDNSDINITVNDGVATLSGTVGTRIGLGAVEADAYAGGASSIVDHVKLENHSWWWWW
jgi:osmotically-inducible protein OsmY